MGELACKKNIKAENYLELLKLELPKSSGKEIVDPFEFDILIGMDNPKQIRIFLIIVNEQYIKVYCFWKERVLSALFLYRNKKKFPEL